MADTLPGPVGHAEFRFVAGDEAGAGWRWIEDQMACERLPAWTSSDDPEADECGMLY